MAACTFSAEEVEGIRGAFADFVGVAHASASPAARMRSGGAARCGVGAGDLVLPYRTRQSRQSLRSSGPARRRCWSMSSPAPIRWLRASSGACCRCAAWPASGDPAGAHLRPAGRCPHSPRRSRHGLRLIEDCAQSHGASHRGSRPIVRRHRVLQLLSDQEPRGARGWRDGRHQRPRSGHGGSRNSGNGWRERLCHARVGINSRLDPLRRRSSVSSSGTVRRQCRTRSIETVTFGLAGLPLALPVRRPEATPCLPQYVIRLAERDALRNRLRAAGIATGIHYPVPAHQQRLCRASAAGRQVSA